jgi:hypothetical protein
VSTAGFSAFGSDIGSQEIVGALLSLSNLLIAMGWTGSWRVA